MLSNPTIEDAASFRVLLACAWAEHVLPIFEKTHPKDRRPRVAIETARAWCRDEATGEELDAARAAARDAAGAAARAAAGAAARAAAWDAAWAAAGDAAWAAARDAAWAAARDAAWAAARAAAWDAARAAEREWQTQTFREMLEAHQES